jgi:hypothetical protein
VKIKYRGRNLSTKNFSDIGKFDDMRTKIKNICFKIKNAQVFKNKKRASVLKYVIQGGQYRRKFSAKNFGEFGVIGPAILPPVYIDYMSNIFFNFIKSFRIGLNEVMTKMRRIKFSTKRSQIKIKKSRFGKFNPENDVIRHVLR